MRSELRRTPASLYARQGQEFSCPYQLARSISSLARSLRCSQVLEGNRENCGVSAPCRPSVQADPQGMQPG